MICQWDKLLAILPGWLRQEVDRQGRDEMQELRLRIHCPPEIVLADRSLWLKGSVSREDLNFCINTASRYSPWASATLGKGFLTAPGGHRIGLCGEAVITETGMTGIRNPTSACIRVARDFPGIADRIPYGQSILILGAPGWGKTTLLRDLIRRDSGRGCHICVVDERGELFPSGTDPGICTDVLTGCSKKYGLPVLLRTMGPECIALDEITEQEDCHALVAANGCGVRLLATAHASSMKDFYRRQVYRPLIENRVFQMIVLLNKDKSWITERMA